MTIDYRHTRYYCALTSTKANALKLEHNYITFTDATYPNMGFVKRNVIIMNSDIVIAVYSNGYYFYYKNNFNTKPVAVNSNEFTLMKLSSVELAGAR
jgi:hypothetical protein